MPCVRPEGEIALRLESTRLKQEPDHSNDRKLRKKLQNRLNQRARRVRIRNSDSTAAPPRDQTRRTFQVDRWRLDEVGLDQEDDPKSELPQNEGKTVTENSISHSFYMTMEFPRERKFCTLDADRYGQRLESILHLHQSAYPVPSPLSSHLLHLVNYNAFRGYLQNKYIIAELAELYTTHKTGCRERINVMKQFPAKTVMLATDANIPPSLRPTPLQMRQAHSTWIDLLPFPKMRDNLIVNEHRFNHWEFLLDLIGNLLNLICMSAKRELGLAKPQQGVVPHSFHVVMDREGLDDGLTATQNGFILWGEPHNMESWEATPGFLQKWGWVVEGCPEVVQYSNKWRHVRGEEPVTFVVTELAEDQESLQG